jgi:hypothetical protein
MSLRVFDFRCPLGHVTEHFVDADIEQVQCHCECMADRVISTPRIALDGMSGHFPTASDAWERRRESHMAKERKNQENHGTYK